jgi:thioesterase domain-containing protein
LFDTLAPGYLQRLPWPAALLADYSYRWKLIAADWKRARRGASPLATFLGNRLLVRKLVGQMGQATPRADGPLSAEQYDQWLLHYLEEAAASYQPRSYPGTMTLFRSSQEPAGRFLDPQMGWGEFVRGGIEVVVIDGDHFSIFQEPSVSQLAQRIESAYP